MKIEEFHDGCHDGYQNFCNLKTHVALMPPRPYQDMVQSAVRFGKKYRFEEFQDGCHKN